MVEKLLRVEACTGSDFWNNEKIDQRQEDCDWENGTADLVEAESRWAESGQFMCVAKALHQEKRSDETWDGDRNRKDIGDLAEREKKNDAKAGVKWGNTSDFLQTGEQEYTNEAGDAEKKDLQVASQKIAP